MLERQEIYCHACGQYVQFDIDLSLNGNHVFKCPNCGHEHCRVVDNGRITGERWDSRNGGMTYTVTNVTFSNTSSYQSYASVSSQPVSTVGSYYLWQAWSGTTSTTWA